MLFEKVDIGKDFKTFAILAMYQFDFLSNMINYNLVIIKVMALTF